jgi:hypothetical protein
VKNPIAPNQFGMESIDGNNSKATMVVESQSSIRYQMLKKAIETFFLSQTYELSSELTNPQSLWKKQNNQLIL